MEKVTQLEAYLNLMKLYKYNFSEKNIANLAFDFYNRWSDKNSKESYKVIYDLALLGEPGMELDFTGIGELISKLYNMDFESAREAENIATDFTSFSKFFLKLENHAYEKSEFQQIYKKLEELYFLALVDCESDSKTVSWKKYHAIAINLIKELFQFGPFIFKTK